MVELPLASGRASRASGLGGGEDAARGAELGHSDLWHGSDSWDKREPGERSGRGQTESWLSPARTRGRLSQAQSEGRKRRFRSRSLGAAWVRGAPDRACPSHTASTSGGLAVGWAGRELAATWG